MNTTDNCVYFADLYWRIFRINEDGSVRLLYAGSDKNTTSGHIGTNSYNVTYNNPRYVGYMYGSTGSVANNRNNTTNSTIKGVIDTWYDNKIRPSYNDYISKTAIYCNDRANEGYGSSDFAYAADRRLSSNIYTQNPSYKCGNNASGSLYSGTNGASNLDKFTASASTGNGKLINPVALMTADEVVFAGGKFNTNNGTAYYTHNVAGGGVTGDVGWWTMSPKEWESDRPYMFAVNNSSIPGPGNLNDVFVFLNTKGVRPVLSLKSCVKWKSGDGTSDNPYTVDTLDSTCSSAEN